MVKVVFVHPESLRNGQVKGGVEKEREKVREKG